MLSGSRTKRAIVRCCSLQDTLHVPPEHRKYRRVHGLQLPLHPQQVIGWVLLAVVFVGTFTVLLTTPPLLPDLRFVLSLLFAALFLLHVLAHLTVLLLDPADPEVRARLADEVVPEFDRTKHRHVIENGRCHLCNITTRGRRTKHCSICNKCVPRFDHHCKWLNNCIGGRNYPAFLACLASTLVVALAVSALSVGELVVVNTDLVGGDRRWIDDSYNDTNMNNATAPSPSVLITSTGSLVLITIIGVLSAVAAVLLIHLCFFHGYIACLGLTTYEYVRSKREKSIADSKTTSSGSLCGTSVCSGNGEDVNQISVTEDLCSRFCINRPSLMDDGSARRAATTRTDVYVRSTHQETQSDDITETADSACSRRSSRNFHLCFSYDSNTTETSIEVSSSRTTTAPTAELKSDGELIDAKSSSTPSPVSCCFSIMNYPESRHHDRSGHKCRSSESNLPKTSKRSCGTMRRIQTFLQTRLRKSSRQRSAISSSPTIARHCGNKVIPQAGESTEVVLASTVETRVVETSTMELATSLPDHIRPPIKLPALDLPRAANKSRRASATPGDISVLVPMPPSATSKRNQAHLCTRRSLSFSRKRPRFKVGSHVVAQTAQLSPIPESEFSKPATPRSPTRPDSVFTFPPLRE